MKEIGWNLCLEIALIHKKKLFLEYFQLFVSYMQHKSSLIGFDHLEIFKNLTKKVRPQIELKNQFFIFIIKQHFFYFFISDFI